MNDPDVRLLLLLILGALTAGGLWYFWDDISPGDNVPDQSEVLPVVDEPAVPAEPQYPLEAPSISDATEAELVLLPKLDDSDEYFLLALADLLGPGIERLLVNEALIDKFVATIDNLPRKHVAEKIRPAGQLSGAFAVDARSETGPYYLSTENFARYDPLVDIATNVDVGAAVAMYRRFYPLMQESYVRLGYPNGYFNDRVVEVIDHLLATPTPAEPIELVQPHVLYEFSDPQLESLSSGQKLMLRMGSANALRLRTTLQQLRASIAR